MKHLSFVNGLVYPLPNATKVSYKLRRVNGSTFSLSLPIFVRVDRACLAVSPGGPDEYDGQYDQRVEYRYPGKPLTFEEQDDMMGVTFEQAVEPANDIPLTPIVGIGEPDQRSRQIDKSIQYGIYKSRQNVSIGIIRYMFYSYAYRITSFRTKTYSASTLLDIRNILTNELSATAGLVIDVRDNAGKSFCLIIRENVGGSISLSESIAQLFRLNVRTNSARALVNPINQKLFADVSNRQDWGVVYAQTRPGDRYTPLIKFTSEIKANKLGNAYGT